MSDDCTWTRSRIDEHVDGTLDPTEAERVAAHLASCAECAALDAQTRTLLASATALATEQLPSRDLWADIEPQLAPPRPTWTPVRLAAAAAVLVALSSGLTALWLSRGDAPAPVLATASEVYAPLDPSPPDWRADMDAAMTELTSALDARRAELDPGALGVIDENLAIIDAAIAEIDQALAAQPDNPRLREALLAVHRQKVQLLVDANHLPG